MTESQRHAVVMAGAPATHGTLYHRIRFSVVDQVALIQLPHSGRSILILRDIEMERAARQARVSDVHCPKDFSPAGGLSGDRETATAQAMAECLRREGIKVAIGDRTLPLIYVEMIRLAGIEIRYDADLGVLARRQKDAEEVTLLREAQRTTEAAMEMACQMIGGAVANTRGELIQDGDLLTSEKVKWAIDQFLLQREFANPASIVAGGPQAADCHEFGSGVLRTSEPIIVDIFPTNRKTRYCGDCTRTVVHGDIPNEVGRMHQAVSEAKKAGVSATRAGVSGEAVHRATLAAIESRGYGVGLPPGDAPTSYCGMTHGTGHGIGLEVHEPPLLDFKGPELLVGDALTIEPGLYCQDIGAVRLEDMVVVTADGCENLNQLSETLDWKSV